MPFNNLKISFWTLARKFIIVCNDVGNRLENFSYWITGISCSAIQQSGFVFVVLLYQGSDIHIERSVVSFRQQRVCLNNFLYLNVAILTYDAICFMPYMRGVENDYVKYVKLSGHEARISTSIAWIRETDVIRNYIKVVQDMNQ